MSTDNNALVDAGNAFSASLTNVLPERWQPFAKAIYTSAIGALVAASFAVDGGITGGEWIKIALGALLPGGTAYGATNR